MSLIQHVTRYYADRAPVFDETAGYVDPAVEQLRIPIKARYRDWFRGHDVLEIACGTGFWTECIAASAHSVLATDVNESMLAIAKERCATLPHVQFQQADAYTLEGIPNGFSAAYAMFWWSHIPVGNIPIFLSALRTRLQPGAWVIIADQLPYDGVKRRVTVEGNTLEERRLPDGRQYEIVKNFPTKQELRSAVAPVAAETIYQTYADEKNWCLRFRMK